MVSTLNSARLAMHSLDTAPAPVTGFLRAYTGIRDPEKVSEQTILARSTELPSFFFNADETLHQTFEKPMVILKSQAKPC